MARRRRACQAHRVSLFRRVVAINAGVLVSAAILLAVSPATVSPTLQLAEAVVLAAEAAGLADVEWYVRSPLPQEAPTQRLYLLGRR